MVQAVATSPPHDVTSSQTQAARLSANSTKHRRKSLSDTLAAIGAIQINKPSRVGRNDELAVPSTSGSLQIQWLVEAQASETPSYPDDVGRPLRRLTYQDDHRRLNFDDV